MDEDVGLFSGLVDEVGGSFEVEAEVIPWMVFSRNIQSIGNLFLRVFDMDVSAGSQQRFDVVL